MLAVFMSVAPEAARVRAALVAVPPASIARARAARGVRVQRLRHDHFEPAQSARVVRRRPRGRLMRRITPAFFLRADLFG